MHQYHVRREDAGTCTKCGAATVVETAERVHTAVGVPLVHGIYRSSTCESCKWWSGGRIKRPDYPRTPGVRQLVVLSWLLVIGACLALIPYKLQRDRIVTAHAAEPRSGDIWEVDLSGWPNRDEGYTRARVDTVTAHDVAISMCGYAYELSSDTDKCESFPHVVPGIPRAEVVRLHDVDTIEDIERDGDDTARVKYFGLWLLGVVALFFVHARRSRRVLA
jgi:hypothetical protein